MVKIKNKKGFTLVECIVAMAVLAIMSLLLMMILNITVNSRNNNQHLEREIDKQIDHIVANESVTQVPFEQTLKFEIVNSGETSYVETIPIANDDNGLDANKIYDKKNEVGIEVDILKYNFKDYQLFKDIKNNTLNPPPGVNEKKAYGGAKIVNGKINVSGSKTEILNGTEVIGYNIILTYSCSVAEFSKTAGIKIVIPSGAYNVKKGDSTNVSTLVLTAPDVIRIQPISGTSEDWKPEHPSNINIVASVHFDISKSDYDRNFKSVGEFYELSENPQEYATLVYEQPDELLPIETAVPD